MEPLLKWVGGKRWQVDSLRAMIGNHRVVEPFCGGAAVTLGVEPKRALLNDINPHLINFYQQVQAGAPFDIAGLNPAMYYSYRAHFNQLMDIGCANTQEAAELFYALNHWGFNGLWRVNSSGYYNVSRGHDKWPGRIPNFNEARELFNHYIFTCADFESLAVSDGDFIYADPPYDGTFDGYASEGFNWRDQERLAYWLAKHPGPFVLMNALTDRVCELYSDLGFMWTEYGASQSMHHSRGRTGKISEVMAFNTQFIVDNDHALIHDGSHV